MSGPDKPAPVQPVPEAAPREDFMRRIDELHKKTGAWKTKVATVLLETVCEVLALHKIRTPADEQKYDPYYNEKHDAARRTFIDGLRAEADKRGIEIGLNLEEWGAMGRHDIVLTSGGGTRRLVVEIKAGMTPGLVQIERYLLEGEKLLLIRVMTKQAMILNPADYKDTMDGIIRNLAAKATRILADRAALIPNYECGTECPIRTCPHNRNKNGRKESAPMESERFGDDLDNFWKNLYPTVNIAVSHALAELGATQKQASRK